MPLHDSKDDWVILNLDQTITNAIPICLWNFASSDLSDNFSIYHVSIMNSHKLMYLNEFFFIFLVQAELENNQFYAASLEDSDVCMHLTERKYLRDLMRSDRFFCMRSDYGNKFTALTAPSDTINYIKNSRQWSAPTQLKQFISDQWAQWTMVFEGTQIARN